MDHEESLNMNVNMKRLGDLFLVVLLSFIFFIPIVMIAIVIWISSGRPIVYWSSRVGKNNQLFLMPKFRTMNVATPQLATHLLKESENYLTKVGSFLRKSSLDELPQLWSVWKGDMSFVGPRPALFNQDDLVEMRTRKGVHALVPGITGLAQIYGRDELSLEEKVNYDYLYYQKRSFILDFKILCLTSLRVLKSEGVHH
jgi:O-antigen biosynthesis protein WbqP